MALAALEGEAMKKFVDAEKMIEDTNMMRQVADGIAIDGIIKYIEENSVDAVPVVLCGECNNRSKTDNNWCCYWMAAINRYVGYCYKGERREEAK